MIRRIALAIGASLVGLLLVELILHAFLHLSPSSLFGSDLGPIHILGGSPDRKLKDPATVIDVPAPPGKHLTWGDLRGVLRLDATIGYTVQENATSTNHWWQSNNLGARSRADADKAVPPGRTRVLVFGDSFAQGSRVQEEEAWPSVMAADHPELDVLNFGVDGYSMGQALLRFRQLRERLDYNVAVLMLAPEEDLWRDINTVRQLQDPGWDMPLMPRFLVRDETLELAPRLYADPLDLYRKNSKGLTPELRDYLRRVDRLYFPLKYEEPHGLSRLLVARVMARAIWAAQEDRLYKGLIEPGSEALVVTRAIVDSMAAEVRKDGATFVLAILPIYPSWWNPESVSPWWWSDDSMAANVATWQRAVAFLCQPQISCIDLLPDLRQLSARDMDRAVDRWHFGPTANRHVAAALYQQLKPTVSASHTRRP